MHQSATDCWVAIDGNVYNLTDWVSKHPGGPDKIIKLCGKDGSVIFNGQHGGQPQPEAALAMFKIGTLGN
jgi:cytochrome b involved in lipid metabolism